MDEPSIDINELEDGTEIVKFTLLGQAMTKKTGSRIIPMGKNKYTGKPNFKLLPKQNYLTYEESCRKICHEIWADKGFAPIDCGIEVEFKVFLRDYRIGDSCGYMQSLGDIIEKHGVIANDIWINWATDKHFLGGIDKENPRVEMRISRLRHPKEMRTIKKIKKEK